ncbi:hypothetical protein ACQVP2_20195 [Methylobacterium aquaticum]|uniref:hypothetical protein n=1 Tax=Methylobacterium aquaticum TaxID=270351 RepID=UPI003D167FD3
MADSQDAHQSEVVPDLHTAMTHDAIRRDRSGWTVYHLRSGAMAVVDDVLQVGLDCDEADSAAEALGDTLAVPALAGMGGRFAWFRAPARP